MQSMLIHAGKSPVSVDRIKVPSCHCTRRTSYGRPERDCACCEGCGGFAECSQCGAERTHGEVFEVVRGGEALIACSDKCVGALLVDAIDLSQTTLDFDMQVAS